MSGLDQYLCAEPKEAFAGIIQFMRERTGYSQGQLGAHIKKDQSEISKYERMAQIPSEKTLIAISDFLCRSDLEAFAVRYFWRQCRK